MKLTVEVNLMNLFSDYETDDWGDTEVESVGETLKSELKTKVLAELSKKMLESYNKKLQDDLEPIYREVLNNISEKIKKVSEEFITQKVSITDDWGDIKKKDVSILDLVKERLEETFDIKNKRSPFREKLDDIFKYELKREVERITDNLKKEMKQKIENETAEQIRKKFFEK